LTGLSVLVLVAATSGVVAVTGTAAGILPGGPMVVVESGRWADVPWTVLASDTSDGQVCLFLRLNGGGSSLCGVIRRQPIRAGGSYGLVLSSGYSGVSYVIGAVAATARSIKITLWNGSVILTRPISAPRGLAGNIDFFAVRRTCTSTEKSIVAKDASGLTVATWTASPASVRRPTSDC
jgi:hypothetical protein